MGHKCIWAAVLLLLTSFATPTIAEEDSAVSPADALAGLKAGNRRFVTDHLEKSADLNRWSNWPESQHPVATIIACADSRVSPELIFNKGLGDLFVLRVAGNVAVDASAIVGSAEYAAEHLKVPLVVVVGHENCGAVKARLAAEPAPGNLGRLLNSVQTGNHLNLADARAKQRHFPVRSTTPGE